METRINEAIKLFTQSSPSEISQGIDVWLNVHAEISKEMKEALGGTFNKALFQEFYLSAFNFFLNYLSYAKKNVKPYCKDNPGFIETYPRIRNILDDCLQALETFKIPDYSQKDEQAVALMAEVTFIHTTQLVALGLNAIFLTINPTIAHDKKPKNLAFILGKLAEGFDETATAFPEDKLLKAFSQKEAEDYYRCTARIFKTYLTILLDQIKVKDSKMVDKDHSIQLMDPAASQAYQRYANIMKTCFSKLPNNPNTIDEKALPVPGASQPTPARMDGTLLFRPDGDAKAASELPKDLRPNPPKSLNKRTRSYFDFETGILHVEKQTQGPLREDDIDQRFLSVAQTDNEELPTQGPTKRRKLA